MLTVGQKLYLERIRRGVSQTELSLRTGIAQGNLSNIENGKQDITVSTLLQICMALGIKASNVLDTPVAGRPKARFSRARLERIAAAVVGPPLPSSKQDREIVRLFRNLVVGHNRKIPSRETTLHWSNLRQQLTDEEIEALRQRVEDALQRNPDAKKHD